MEDNARLFLRHVGQTSETPLMLEVDRAEGCYFYAPDGRSYLDLISGISVSNFGHGNKAIVEAVQKQAARYMHVMVYGEYIESPQVLYAEWLAQTLPDPIDSVFFVNSGSEAVEGAIKLAKRVTRRPEIISFANGYHGATMGALSAGGQEDRKNAFRPLIPANRILPFNDLAALDYISENTAAVLVEPVQGEAGIRLPDENYLQALRIACDEKGAMLVFDECQTGFGRTGALFACLKYRVTPDIITMGKALGAGMPLGAFAASRESMQTLTHQPVLGHITTFGGHPVSCAAGLAGAQQLDAALLNSVERKAKVFVETCVHPAIQDIRSAGLLICVDLPSFEFNQKVINRLIAKGIVTDWFLYHDTGLRIAPPLIISVDEIRDAAQAIVAAIEEVVST